MLKLLSLFQTVEKKYDDNSLGSIIITLHFNMWMKETYKFKKKIGASFNYSSKTMLKHYNINYAHF